MKQGRSIEALVEEVNRQHASKHDILATTSLMSVYTPDMTKYGYGVQPTEMSLGSEGVYKVNEHAHSQLASLLKIPKLYYDRMREEQPHLLDVNVNTWLSKSPADEKRLVRTLDDNVRAVLSQRFHTLDYIDLMRFIVPVFAEFTDLTVVSCEITEKRVYIKVQRPSLLREIKKGQMVAFGGEFSTSEVGAGAWYTLPYSVVLDCTNGMRHAEFGKRRHHVGRKLESGEEFEAYYTDEARQADDHAFFLKTRDTVRAMLGDDIPNRIADQMRKAAGVELPEPEATIEVLSKKSGFTEDETALVLRHMMRGGDTTLWGLANAVTRTAEDLADYDRASEFEVLGGRIIDLSPAEYRVLVKADASKAEITESSKSLALAVA